MKKFDIGIGWANPVDEKFINRVKAEARNLQASVYEINFANLADSLDNILAKRIEFSAFLDRGSIDHPAFFVIAQKMIDIGARVVNMPLAVTRFTSKAQCVKRFSKLNIPMAPVIILPAYIDSKNFDKKITEDFIEKIGKPFALKLSRGGYNNDIILNAKDINDINNFRREHSTEEVLIQKFIIPRSLLGKTTWFRTIYACGAVYPFWWNPGNHYYESLGKTKTESNIVLELKRIAKLIANATKMDIFSSEVAIDEHDNYFLIDYVNHPIDIHAQSEVLDGVPDASLNEIAKNITRTLLNER